MMENKRGRMDLLTQEQIDWCNKHCKFDWFVKDDGKVYSNDESIHFKDKKIINSFLVKFGDCKNFNCFGCKSLKSLEGVSESVSGNFYCFYCKSLKSLKGIPDKVGGDFSCAYCYSLESLEEAPESVGGYFCCSLCDSLKSLEGASKNVGEFFSCSSCHSLESLEGAPENVGGDFDCSHCDLLKSFDVLKNTKIGKKIYHEDCPKLKKYDLILSDMNWFRKWQKSEYTADEFMKEYDGFLQAKKYGI